MCAPAPYRQVLVLELEGHLVGERGGGEAAAYLCGSLGTLALLTLAAEELDYSTGHIGAVDFGRVPGVRRVLNRAALELPDAVLNGNLQSSRLTTLAERLGA